MFNQAYRPSARARRSSSWLMLLWIVPLLLSDTAAAQAIITDYAAQKKQAIDLCEANKFAEARPLLEKLIATNPTDIEVLEWLAMTAVAQAVVATDSAARQQAFLQARQYALRAKELGNNSNRIELLINKIPADGGSAASFSDRKEVNDAMHEGERAFANGEFEQAIAAYQRAFAL